MEKVKIFMLLFDPDCKHCSGKDGDIERIQKDSKGMNYKANYKRLQGDDGHDVTCGTSLDSNSWTPLITRPTCHSVPWVPSGHCS